MTRCSTPKTRVDRLVGKVLVGLLIAIDMVLCIGVGGILGASGFFLMP